MHLKLTDPAAAWQPGHPDRFFTDEAAMSRAIAFPLVRAALRNATEMVFGAK
jgi:hypothetical protein